MLLVPARGNFLEQNGPRLEMLIRWYEVQSIPNHTLVLDAQPSIMQVTMFGTGGKGIESIDCRIAEECDAIDGRHEESTASVRSMTSMTQEFQFSVFRLPVDMQHVKKTPTTASRYQRGTRAFS